MSVYGNTNIAEPGKFISKAQFMRAFIEPMVQFNNWSFNDSTLDLWYDKLKNNDENILKKTSDKIIENCPKRPSFAEIIKYLESAKASFSKFNKPQQCSWEQKRFKTKEMTDEYCLNYKKTSPIYWQALSHGYEQKLMEYVREVANIQAQMINKCNGISFQTSIILDYINEEEYESCRRALFSECYLQAQRGFINVNPPDYKLLEKWRSIKEQQSSDS